ncbi:hypothetical protein BDQ17DRAFT_1344801, partial [Cyathus striatus]
MSNESKPTSSEDILGQKYDRCLADFLVKSGVGFSVGVIASVILFRRRTWPSRCQQASVRAPHMQTVTAPSTPPEYPARESSHRSMLQSSKLP